jgi:hypothetical protein
MNLFLKYDAHKHIFDVLILVGPFFPSLVTTDRLHFALLNYVIRYDKVNNLIIFVKIAFFLLSLLRTKHIATEISFDAVIRDKLFDD